MSCPEPASHTFLLRIWVEETAGEAQRLAWRGHITHLPDEERRYVETFWEIARFIHERVGSAVEERAGEWGGHGDARRGEHDE